MFRHSLFVILGLIAALTLGCEKKEATPVDAAPAVEAAEGAQSEGEDATKDAAEAIEEAAEEVEDAAGEIKDAAEGIKVPG